MQTHTQCTHNRRVMTSRQHFIKKNKNICANSCAHTRYVLKDTYAHTGNFAMAHAPVIITHTHTHTHTHKHIQTHTHKHTHAHTYTHRHIYE